MGQGGGGVLGGMLSDRGIEIKTNHKTCKDGLAMTVVFINTYKCMISYREILHYIYIGTLGCSDTHCK